MQLTHYRIIFRCPAPSRCEHAGEPHELDIAGTDAQAAAICYLRLVTDGSVPLAGIAAVRAEADGRWGFVVRDSIEIEEVGPYAVDRPLPAGLEGAMFAAPIEQLEHPERYDGVEAVMLIDDPGDDPGDDPEVIYTAGGN